MTSGLGQLYLFLIRNGQPLYIIQKVINKIQNKKNYFYKFIYKSIGGCGICTIQRFADFIYIAFVIINEISVSPILLFIYYCLFGGSVYFFSNVIQIYQNKVESKTTKLDI